MVAEIDPVRRGEGIRMERLVPYAPGHLLQGNIHVVAAGGGTDGLITHDGEEVGYVIAGRIELRVGDASYEVEAGDSFYYRSERPHGYRNIGDCEARIIFINTPPSF
jgi:quercetin dioxygenase-like cupin family protein